MRVRSRSPAAMALPLVAVALAGGACGGGASPTHSTGGGDEARSGRATARTSQQRPRDARPAWPHAKMVDLIAGRTIRVDGRPVRVDRATVTCGGEGPGSRRGRKRIWERFTCIQPTFGGHGTAGPDVVFRAQPTGPRSLRITDQRFTRY
jgi:hypothetical protein